MGGLPRLSSQAIDALARRDSNAALQVIESDKKIACFGAGRQQLTIRLLALRQPMATDSAKWWRRSRFPPTSNASATMPRTSPSVHSTSSSLCARYRSRAWASLPGGSSRMLDAYVEKDADRALAAGAATRKSTRCTPRCCASPHLHDGGPAEYRPHPSAVHRQEHERIGDHATNIAETVHSWPRADRSMKLDRRRYHKCFSVD